LHQGSFRGSVPLEPARFLYSLDRARPVEFALDLPEGDLAAVPGATDLVADAAGRFSGRIVVSGTIAIPISAGISRSGTRASGSRDGRAI